MQINPVSSPPATHAAAATQSSRITPSQVSASALQRANGDGDGRTGAAALNDGDGAARSAAQQVRLNSVDVRA